MATNINFLSTSQKEIQNGNNLLETL